MLVIDSVSKAFNGRQVLTDVSFNVASGEMVGLVGPSGGGKSVLLKILGGVVAPDLGRISFSASVVEGSVARVGFLFQEGALFDSMTVLENVAFPLLTRHDLAGGSSVCSRRDGYARAHELLSEVGLGDAWKKVPGQLSGGMRRRVGIARALVAQPEIVLLDDPTGGLDPVAASVIMNLIKRLHDHYSPAIVVVSHDLRRLIPSVDRLLGLFSGKIDCNLAPKVIEAEAPAHVRHFLQTRFDFSTLA